MRGRPRPPGRPERDGGQITVLLLGYAVILLAVVLTFAAVTGVHLARHRLHTLAEAAALDAAGALDRGRFYTGTGTGAGAGGADPQRPVALSTASVRSEVAAFLAAGGPGGHPDLLDGRDVHVDEPTGTPDGSTAEVTLVVTVPVPFVSALIGDTGAVTVRVTARARARPAG